ncbi:helix-turn-helix domain-containing protein [Streptomyces sp. NPDC051064]|uniref:helix-turn-helix domain-containing protein n=1 Tax=Streptomyces sp. NPDC051064 TaxID=3365641 RepID=UPI0037A829F5
MTSRDVGRVPPGARALVREDGTVVIPAALAGEVLRRLLRDVTAEISAAKGQPSTACRELLWGLHLAAKQAEKADGSTRGTPEAGSAKVEISTSEAAHRLGCSESYARRLARTGRLRGRKVGPVWLVAEAAIVAPERTGEAA